MMKMDAIPQSSGVVKTSKANESHRSYLPNDYVPSSNDVIVGRGKKCYNHEGNKRLRLIVDSKLEQYSAASNKYEKSSILATVVKQIRSGNSNGKFVRQDTNTKLWYDIGDDLAKEKTSQTFRNALIYFESSLDAANYKRKQEDWDVDALSPKKRQINPATNLQQNLLHNATISHINSDHALDKDVDSLDLYSLSSEMFFYDDPYEPTPIEEIVEQHRISLRNFDPIPFNKENFQQHTHHWAHASLD